MTFPWLQRLAARNYDVMVRYHPVARQIRRQDPAHRWSVLDVGCGTGGLAPFLGGWRLTGVDATRPDTPLSALQFCQASATRLPFRDGSWDVVTCIDVLEHLPAESRALAILEVFRVARQLVIIASPCGPAARHADESMHRAYAKQNQRPPAWLDEHLRHPYLDATALADSVREAGRASGLEECIIFFNESLALQRIHRYLGRTTRVGYKLFSLLCSLAIPVLARPTSAGSAYRCFAVATRPRAAW